MSYAVLVADERIGKIVKASLPITPTQYYTNLSAIEQNKVIFVLVNYTDNDIKTTLIECQQKQKEVFCIVDEADRKKWEVYLTEMNIPFLVNNVDGMDALLKFLNNTVQQTVKQKTIAVTSGNGGAGKTFLSGYLGKRISENHKTRLVDWNYFSPSINQYFEQLTSETDVVEALKLLRNGMQVDLSTYQNQVSPNLTLSLMSLDYFESTKWTPQDFAQLWDHYEGQGEEAIIYEIPIYPFSISAAVALMRATDIVITVLPDENSVRHGLTLLSWIKHHRSEDLPAIHVVLNRFNSETSTLVVSDVERTLGEKVKSVIPEYEDAWTQFVSDELFKYDDKTEALDQLVQSMGFNLNQSIQLKRGFMGGLFNKKEVPGA